MRDDHDDLGALFARTAVVAPADIGRRARARLRAIRGARRLTLLALVDAVALLTLAAFACLLGAAVADSGLLALLRAGLRDHSLLTEARREVALAVVWGVPWLYVLAVTLNTAVLYALTSYLLDRTDAVRAAAREGWRR